MSNLSQVSKMIKSVLLSFKHGISLEVLEKNYRDLIGSSIPYQQFGFNSLQHLIDNSPDVAKVQPNGMVIAVHDASTEHLKKLIARQKSPPTRQKRRMFNPPIPDGPLRPAQPSLRSSKENNCPNLASTVNTRNRCNMLYRNEKVRQQATYNRPKETSKVDQVKTVELQNHTPRVNQGRALIQPKKTAKVNRVKDVEVQTDITRVNQTTSVVQPKETSQINQPRIVDQLTKSTQSIFPDLDLNGSDEINANLVLSCYQHKKDLEDHCLKKNMDFSYSTRKVGVNISTTVVVNGTLFSTTPRVESLEQSEVAALRKAILYFQGWSPLNISTRLQEVLINRFEFDLPRSIQADALPQILSNQNVVLIGPENTGKIVTCAISIFEKLFRLKPTEKGGVKALVLYFGGKKRAKLLEIFQAFVECFPQFSILDPGEDGSVVNSTEKHKSFIYICSMGKFLNLLEKKQHGNIFDNLEVLTITHLERSLNFKHIIFPILEKLPKPRVHILVGTEIPANFFFTSIISIPYTYFAIKDTCNVYTNSYLEVESQLHFSTFVRRLIENEECKVLVLVSTNALAQYFASLLPTFLNEIPVFHVEDGVETINQTIEDFEKQTKGLLLCSGSSINKIKSLPQVERVIFYDILACYLSIESNFYNPCIEERNSLLFILPQELEFLEYIKGKGIPLKRESHLNATINLLSAINQIVSNNKELYQVSLKAFSSYLAVVSEYNNIFPFENLKIDIHNLTLTHGL